MPTDLAVRRARENASTDTLSGQFSTPAGADAPAGVEWPLTAPPTCLQSWGSVQDIGVLARLPEAFTQDPDRLARFEREAKVLASLNHPNIGSIYGLEEAAGVKAPLFGRSAGGYSRQVEACHGLPRTRIEAGSGLKP